MGTGERNKQNAIMGLIDCNDVRADLMINFILLFKFKFNSIIIINGVISMRFGMF